MDPVKELQAHQMAYELGVTSLTDIAASQGRDLEDVFDQRRKEQDMLAEFGVQLTQPAQAPMEVDDGND